MTSQGMAAIILWLLAALQGSEGPLLEECLSGLRCTGSDCQEDAVRPFDRPARLEHIRKVICYYMRGAEKAYARQKAGVTTRYTNHAICGLVEGGLDIEYTEAGHDLRFHIFFWNSCRSRDADVPAEPPAFFNSVQGCNEARVPSACFEQDGVLRGRSAVSLFSTKKHYALFWTRPRGYDLQFRRDAEIAAEGLKDLLGTCAAGAAVAAHSAAKFVQSKVSTGGIAGAVLACVLQGMAANATLAPFAPKAALVACVGSNFAPVSRGHVFVSELMPELLRRLVPEPLLEHLRLENPRLEEYDLQALVDSIVPAMDLPSLALIALPTLRGG